MNLVRITLHRGAFVQPMLQWESNKYYVFWVCVCSLRYQAWTKHEAYYLWRRCNIFFHIIS